MQKKRMKYGDKIALFTIAWYACIRKYQESAHTLVAHERECE